MTFRRDVAVIGGGVAGLSAAAVAARAGSTVTVLDAGPLGGRARTVDRDGFRLNQGPHAMYLGGAFQRLLTSLGVHRPGGSPSIARAQAALQGRNHALPSGAASLLRSRILGPRGKAAAARTFGRLQRLDADALDRVTVAEWLDAERLPADAAALLSTFVRLTTYTHAPDRMSAGAAIRQLRIAGEGVRYLDRGFQQAIDGLAAVARTAGATVQHGRRVTAVRADGDSWVVAADGGEIVARTVVIAAGGPGATTQLLGEDPAGWVERAGPRVEAACLDLGLRRPPDPPILLGLDEPLYLSTHAPLAALAPDGHALVAVMRYLAPGETRDAETTRRELEAHAAQAGVRNDDIVLTRYLHRMTVAHGMPVAEFGGLSGRPGVTVPERPGLFVAGDWVGDEGMLSDAAAASGAAAAVAAQRHLTAVAA